MIDTHKKSIAKSIIWRLLGVVILASVVYFYTRNWIITGLVTIIHHATFLLVFYLHERLWFKIRLVGRLRRIIKALTYELILGMGLGGLIVLIIAGKWAEVGQITVTYTIIKIVTYYFYERLWVKKVVYAYMVGDVVHIGHLKHLRNAKKQGNYLVVGVLTDEATMEKKPKPIISFQERLEIVRALRYVDKVMPQYIYSPLENVEIIKPDVLMESDSHAEQPANDYVRSYGGKIVITPYYKLQSSTKIKQKINETIKS